MFEFLKDHIPVSRKKYKKLLIKINEEKCRMKQLEQENDMLTKFQSGENCIAEHCGKCKYGYIKRYSYNMIEPPKPIFGCAKKISCKEFELK